jgi:hypothetical protein
MRVATAAPVRIDAPPIKLAQVSLHQGCCVRCSCVRRVTSCILRVTARAASLNARLSRGACSVAHTAMIGVGIDVDACGAAGRGRATAATLTAPAFLGGGAGSITAPTVRRVVARHDAGAVAIDGAARAVDHALSSRAAQAGSARFATAAAIGRIRADRRASIAAADLPRSARTLTADARLRGFALTSAATAVEGISAELDACRAAFVEAGRARASPLAAAQRSGTGVAARPAVQIARVERDAVRSTQVFFDPARDELGAAFHGRGVSTGRGSRRASRRACFGQR